MILNPQFKKTAKELKLNQTFRVFEQELGAYMASGLNDVLQAKFNKNLILELSPSSFQDVCAKLEQGISEINTKAGMKLSDTELQAWTLLFRLAYIPVIANECGAINLHFNFKEISIRGLFDISFGYMLGKYKNRISQCSHEQMTDDLKRLICLLDSITAQPVSQAKKDTLLYHAPLLFTEDLMLAEHEFTPHLFAIIPRIEDTHAYSDEKLVALSYIFQSTIFNPKISEGKAAVKNSAFISYLAACYNLDMTEIDPINVFEKVPMREFTFYSMDFIAHTIIALNNMMVTQLYEPHEYTQFGTLPFGFCGALITLSAFSCEVSFTVPKVLNPRKTLFSDFHTLDWANDDFNKNLNWVADHLVSFYKQGYGGYTMPNEKNPLAIIADFVKTDLELILRFNSLATLSELNVDSFVDEALHRAG